MKIVVLVKQVPDTYGDRALDPDSGRIVRDGVDLVADEIDERALEAALARKDRDKSTEVVLLTMGPASATDALRRGLSMGADSAVHVLDPGLAGSDAGWTAQVLAAALRRMGFDLVIAGNESTDGRGGVVPAAVAELLGVPLLGFVDGVELDGGVVRGVRSTDFGTQRLSAALPAVASVTESAQEARFPNFKGIMTAKRKPLTVFALAELELDPARAGGRSVVRDTTQRPPRTGGTRVVDEGNAGVELADFLVSQRLI